MWNGSPSVSSGKRPDPINIKSFSWKAHLYSYGFLYLILAGGSIYSNIG